MILLSMMDDAPIDNKLSGSSSHGAQTGWELVNAQQAAGKKPLF